MRLTVRACVAMKGYFKLRVCLFKTWALSQRTSFSFLDLGKKKKKSNFYSPKSPFGVSSARRAGVAGELVQNSGQRYDCQLPSPWA